MATLAFIRQNKFEETLKISEMLLNDKHDLIHKAVGWMCQFCLSDSEATKLSTEHIMSYVLGKGFVAPTFRRRQSPLNAADNAKVCDRKVDEREEEGVVKKWVKGGIVKQYF